MEQRQEAFKLGIGTTHWPTEFIEANWGGYRDQEDVKEEERFYHPIEMTKDIQNLIG